MPQKKSLLNKSKLYKKLLKHSRQAKKLVVKRARLLSLFAGCIVVVIWTIYRHISNGINFDVVGQIGLAQQWANGMISGSQIGLTNYVLKMPVYFVANGFEVLSPMGRLLLLALLFNVATFIFIFVIIEKILKLEKIKNLNWFYVAFLWLAVIAGDVFWVDYANSRNLEIVGGLLILYLWLKFINRPKWYLLPSILLVASITFFADSLMFYLFGLGIVTYCWLRLLGKLSKTNLLIAISASAITGLGYVISKQIFRLISHFYNVTFYSAPYSRPELSLGYAWQSIKSLITNTLDIFGANFWHFPLNLNSFRQIINALILVFVITLLIKFRNIITKKIVAQISITVIIFNYLIYLASGQVSQWATSRYLVIVPILTVLLVGLIGGSLNKKKATKLQTMWLGILVISSLLIIGALVMQWPTKHEKDKHIYTVINFMQSQHYNYALSDRSHAINATYLSSGKQIVLPFGCNNKKLTPTNLFYDNSMFIELKKYVGEVPIILSNDEIVFGEQRCSKKDIIKQFGEPLRQQSIAGVGTALIYYSDSLKIPEIDKMAGYENNNSLIEISKIAKASTLTPFKGCQGKITDIIVAHPDDDLLFINPDIQNKLNNGWCIRAVYMTGADDGRETNYWLRREEGIQKAYSVMLGVQGEWQKREVIIDGHSITTSQLGIRPDVSLVFVRLPDGGVRGKGYSRTSNHSIEKMSHFKNQKVNTLDGKSSYNYQALVRVVGAIIAKDQPAEILTTVSSGELSVGDHSDHIAVGQIAKLSASAVKSSASITTYVGYPSSRLSKNLSPEQSLNKKNIFSNYASEDEAICEQNNKCSIEITYENYFSRRYSVEQKKQQLSTAKKKVARQKSLKNIPENLWLANLAKNTKNNQF